jgi:hypothetical protein
MFVWGSKGGVADLGPQESRHCPACEKERSFRLMLQYKVSHVWYVFKWVSEKQYALVCEVCHRGEKLVAQAVEAKLGKPRIPATFGPSWKFVVAVIACLAAFGWWASSGQAEHTKGLLAAPQKSDLYVVNVASLLKSPQALGMYGVLRVRSVHGDRVEFDTPAVAYDKVSGANKDLRNGKLANPDYFKGEPLVLSRGELEGLQRSGALHSIHRP